MSEFDHSVFQSFFSFSPDELLGFFLPLFFVRHVFLAYPEGHPDSSASVPLPSTSTASTSQPQGTNQDMLHLLDKQNSGADFIVTQLFYDVDGFIKWYKRCREAGELLISRDSWLPKLTNLILALLLWV